MSNLSEKNCGHKSDKIISQGENEDFCGHSDGRFPSNFIYTGCDEVFEEFDKAGNSKSTPNIGLDKYVSSSVGKNVPFKRGGETFYTDEGSAARYFQDINNVNIKKNKNDMKIKLMLGDAIDKLKKIPDNYVDSIVTDPPAGISFMGKDWDHDKGGRDEWIEYMKNIYVEAFRTIKPGGHCFVWALPRTSHWTATALENAGFEIRDVVTHVFGSGFPKSHNISKAIDKDNGKGKNLYNFTKWFDDLCKEKNITNKDIDNYLGLKSNGSTASHFRSQEQQPRFPRLEYYYKLQNWLGFDKTWDEIIIEAEREIVGKKKGMKGWDIPVERNITLSKLDDAKKWEGWGTALKPANEEYILCRKPIDNIEIYNIQKIIENICQFLLNVNAAELVLMLNQVEQKEELNSVLWNVEQRFNILESLSVQTVMSPLKKMILSFLSIAKLWNNISEELLKPENKYIISTGSKATIELKTLNYYLSENIPEDIIKVKIQNVGEILNVKTAEKFMNIDPNGIEENFVVINALLNTIKKIVLPTKEIEQETNTEDLIKKYPAAENWILCRKPLSEKTIMF